ncbi:MAG: methionine biosynthesis protein MetW [Candidatus Aceula meridiana]|nr:methionine biosynthesis protein MetW [Candidatus Aceula meridiana]
MSPNKLRLDHKIISGWIAPNSRVLDLGCGDGELLAYLMENKSVRGTGIEINESHIYKCVEKGISVSHSDIDSGLPDYPSKSFNYVILNESLQEVLHPKMVVLEALRVGKKVIVGIPNFCHWPARVQLFFKGKVPVTKGLPHQWYDTPNLNFLSLKDFRNFCKNKKILIEKFKAISSDKIVTLRPNFFAHSGLFLLSKK